MDKIFPSDVCTFVTRVLTLPSLEFPCVLVLSLLLYLHWILSGVFLLEKMFFLTLYLLSFTIIGLGLFWPAFFFWILCVQSRSAGEISMFIFIDIVSTTKSSVIISFNCPMNQETVSARILLINLFFEVFNFLIHYWHIFFQILDYFLFLFSFFLILVKFCAYKITQNLKYELGETLRGNRRNTEGNRRNTGRNMRKHQGKHKGTVRKPGILNTEGITRLIRELCSRNKTAKCISAKCIYIWLASIEYFTQV